MNIRINITVIHYFNFLDELKLGLLFIWENK